MDDENNLANGRQERHEQGGFLGLSIQFLLTIQALIQVLVNLLQVQNQNSASTFETHRTITSLFIGAMCVYFLALMELYQPISNARYHRAARLICYISGVIACTCLLEILFPGFGWLILSLSAIRILPDLLSRVIELLDGIYIRLVNIYDSILQYYLNPNGIQAESGPPEDGSGEPTDQQEDGGV